MNQDDLAFFADALLLPIWVYSAHEFDIILEILEDMFLREYPEMFYVNNLNVNNEIVWLQSGHEFLNLENISDSEL